MVKYNLQWIGVWGWGGVLSFLIYWSLHLLTGFPSLYSPFVTANTGSCLTSLRNCACAYTPLAETETDGTTPTGYMCLLSVRTLCQEVWTCMPLRVTLSPSGCRVASSKPQSAVSLKLAHRGQSGMRPSENRKQRITILTVSLLRYNIPVWPFLAAEFTHHPVAPVHQKPYADLKMQWQPNKKGNDLSARR